MAATALGVRLFIGKPVFFTQSRPGKNNELFELVKFRSMSEERDETGELLSDDLRLKSFGKLLRASSLDELPELINVLKGEMSIVGPRPLLEEYLDLYTPHQKRRQETAPGITGLAQVSGRNALSWEERFDLDVAYVDEMSFLGDLKIIAKTVQTVLSRSGISDGSSATQARFTGSE